MSMKDFARTVIRMSADTMKKEEANFYASDMLWISLNPPFYLPQDALLVPITTAKYLIGSDEVDITLDSVKITKVYISASAYVFIWANVEQHDNTAGTGTATKTLHTDGFIQTAEIPIKNGWQFNYGESIKVTISNSDQYSPEHEIRDNYGYTAGGSPSSPSLGNVTAATEKYDDVANTWTTKANMNTARFGLGGFSLNGYSENRYVGLGYTAGGYASTSYTAATEIYDNLTNTWTAKANLNTARYNSAGFSLNGYGYTAGGDTTGGGVVTAATEKYDDVANTWTAKADLNTARSSLAGFSLNDYGYTAGGYGPTAAVEKYDDVADTWTAKADLNTSRSRLAGFSLNDYGYTAGGYWTGATEKYDDVANTWTDKADLNTARYDLTGFSLNGYGYTIGGFLIAIVTAATEKYDDMADTWTIKTGLNTARSGLAGFSDMITDSHRYAVTLLGTAKPNMEDLRAKLEARGVTI